MFGMHLLIILNVRIITTNEYFVLNKYTVSEIFVPFSSELHKCIKHIEYFLKLIYYYVSFIIAYMDALILIKYVY